MLNFPFPQTYSKLSAAHLGEVPKGEDNVLCAFFSLESFIWFSEMQCVTRISDDSMWANDTNAHATTDIAK